MFASTLRVAARVAQADPAEEVLLTDAQRAKLGEVALAAPNSAVTRRAAVARAADESGPRAELLRNS